MRQIIVDITPAGSVKVEAVGFKGKGCATATEQIEVAIGGAGARKTKKKPDFFAAPVVGTQSSIKRM